MHNREYYVLLHWIYHLQNELIDYCYYWYMHFDSCQYQSSMAVIDECTCWILMHSRSYTSCVTNSLMIYHFYFFLIFSWCLHHSFSSCIPKIAYHRLWNANIFLHLRSRKGRRSMARTILCTTGLCLVWWF